MNSIIQDVKDIVKNIGGEVYIVGGYIRDKLLEKKEEPKDIDIIYNGDINRFIEALQKKGYHTFVIKDNMGIYRASINERTLDIAALKGHNIEEDLKNRDFTVNAIALKLIDNKIIDPFSGRKHIKSRIIHEVEENSIKKDRVRILRAFRFSIKYGMHFSKSCEEHITEESKFLKNSPKERIFTELIEIINQDKNGIAFEEMERYNVLYNLVPYIEELKTIGKCKYHIEDVFTHMNLVYSNSKELVKGALSIKGLDLDCFKINLGEVPISTYFYFAAFCHDIGKAKCYKKIDDRVSFIGHDLEGANIAEEICSDLGFPKKAGKFISILISAHMYPLFLYKNNPTKYKKSFYKFFSKYNEYVPYILALSYCDILATKMLYDPDNEEALMKEYIEKILEEYKIFKKAKENRFIDGNDIINITGANGEDIKRIIDEIDRKVYYGEITTREEALKYLV